MSINTRQAASFGPRELKDKQSPLYAWQTVHRMRHIWDSWQFSQKEWSQILAEAENAKIYQRIPEERPYGSMDIMLEAEGIPKEAADPDSPVVLGRQGGANNPDGINQYTPLDVREKLKAESGQVDNCQLDHQGGNHAPYLTARIARDNPDILADMKAGKYRSVRAAAIDAGIIKPRKRISMYAEPEAVIEALPKHFNREQLAAIYEGLQRWRQDGHL